MKWARSRKANMRSTPQKIKDLLTTQVFPAYQLLIDGLGSLKGTGTSDQGLCTLPDGKQCYEALL